jgi:hypothetical protein
LRKVSPLRENLQPLLIRESRQPLAPPNHQVERTRQPFASLWSSPMSWSAVLPPRLRAPHLARYVAAGLDGQTTCPRREEGVGRLGRWSSEALRAIGPAQVFG